MTIKLNPHSSRIWDKRNNCYFKSDYAGYEVLQSRDGAVIIWDGSERNTLNPDDFEIEDFTGCYDSAGRPIYEGDVLFVGGEFDLWEIRRGSGYWFAIFANAHDVPLDWLLQGHPHRKGPLHPEVVGTRHNTHQELKQLSFNNHPYWLIEDSDHSLSMWSVLASIPESLTNRYLANAEVLDLLGDETTEKLLGLYSSLDALSANIHPQHKDAYRYEVTLYALWIGLCSKGISVDQAQTLLSNCTGFTQQMKWINPIFRIFQK